MNKLNKIKNYILSNKVKLIPYVMVLTILLLSIGYSSFSSNLNIDNLSLQVRVKQDIRVTGVSVVPESEVAENPFSYGTAYQIDPGDGITRTFYVLEDGDNTTLTKGDFTQVHYDTDMIGTAGPGEVALIMDSNYDSTKQPWCDQDGDNPKNNICNADGLTAKLNEIIAAWTELDADQIGLPTRKQIVAATTEYSVCSPPSWLSSNLNGTSGYWSSSASSTSTLTAALAYGSYCTTAASVNITSSYGVRPVITIPKSKLGIINNNGGESTYTEYNVSNIQAGINLPNGDSSVTFKVEITNIEAAEMGILEITGLPDNIEYELLDYNLKEKICDSSGKCNLGIKKEIQIKIKYKDGGYDSSNTYYDVVANFDFQPFYIVTYTDINEPICTYKGTDESAKYSLGAEYECDPGDGVSRTFYVLEVGTNPVDNSTLLSDEVALIMDSNIDNTAVKWCKTEEENTCNANGANETLNNKTLDWQNVTVSLPTIYQIGVVNEYWSVDGYGYYTIEQSYSWLTKNLDTDSSTETLKGYWTSTGQNWDTKMAWDVTHECQNSEYGCIYSDIVSSDTIEIGIRPVITISKSQIDVQSDLPTEVLGGDTLTVNFGDSAPEALKIKIGDSETSNYTYSDGVLSIPNVSDNVEIIKDTIYQQVEYIESTGTQYILTDVIPDDTTGVLLDFSVSDTQGDTLFFGSRSTQNGRFWDGQTDGNYYYGWNADTPYVRDSEILVDNRFIIEKNYYNDRSNMYDGNLFSSISGTLSVNNHKMAIFAGNDAGTISYYSKIRLYELKITKGSNLVAHFIPSYRKTDGEIGLYDLVEGKFYTNSGTGDFVTADT